VRVGQKIFLAVVLSQLLSIALIFGWYFYALRSELNSLTRQRAQEAVLQSIAATEDYFKPAEMALEAGQFLLSDHILGLDKTDQLEHYFFEQLRLRPLLLGLLLGNPAGEFFYVMRSNEKVEGGTRTKVIRNGSLGREVELTWRRPDYAIVKSERDPEDTYDPRARGWYRSAVERRGRVWTEPYIFFTSHKPGITLASAIIGKNGAVEAVLGADIEISEISRFLARTSLLRGKSVYISTSEGKVIAHSSASVVLPATAGDSALRFRTISELPGIEGTASKRLSEPTGTRSANVWEEEVGRATLLCCRWPNVQHRLAVAARCHGTENWTAGARIQKHRLPDWHRWPRHFVCLCHRVRNEPGHRRAGDPIANECAAGPYWKYRAHGRREHRLQGNR
jgi:hypothetical protein